jgi:DNA-binding NarL/FixJ family response regulator/signal transduction histidine kinase
MPEINTGFDEHLVEAIAVATDVQELAESIARAAQVGSGPVTVRLWSAHAPELREVIRHPAQAILPAWPQAAETAAVVDLEVEGDVVGKLELHGMDAATVHVSELTRKLLALRFERVLQRAGPPALGAGLPTDSLRDEVEEVVAAFAEEAQRALPHDRLSIYLLTPDGTGLERFAVASSAHVPGDKDIHPLSATGLSRVLVTNRPIVSDDFGVDERFPGESDATIYRAGYRSIVSAPLRLRGTPFGVLNFLSRATGAYAERDVVVAQQIADQVASFLRDLRLQQTIRDNVRRRAVQEERDRLAREFHDTIAQSVTAISVGAERLTHALPPDSLGHEEARSVQQLACNLLAELRASLLATPPPELEGRSLPDAVQETARQLERSGEERIDVQVRGDGSALPRHVQIATLRILQEALANVRKHARAAVVDDGLTLTVRDDGRGFVAATDGFGLTSMHQRAEAVGGRLSVTSQEGGPTEVTFTAPVAAASPEDDAVSLSAPQTVVRVLVVDDHTMFRDGVVKLLSGEPGLAVVGGAATAKEAVAMAELLRPDVVLLDFDLPDRSGVDVARELCSGAAGPVVLMMSAFVQAVNVSDALDAGVHGYLSKDSSREELVNAIRAALRGARFFDTTSWSELRSPGSQLTRRELEVLQLMAEGETNAAISAELHLAVKTVERIVRTICAKLGCRNRTHAVALGLAHNVIRTPSLERRR